LTLRSIPSLAAQSSDLSWPSHNFASSSQSSNLLRWRHTQDRRHIAHIYELIYSAENPLVLGLGFAAKRDLASFLRNDLAALALLYILASVAENAWSNASRNRSRCGEWLIADHSLVGEGSQPATGALRLFTASNIAYAPG
jgi:hypothetical protein